MIRILIGNAGVGTNEHRQLADQIARAAAQDPSLVGIVGLEESNYNTKALIRKLGTMGLPVISATLSADGLGDYAANYFHMAPENSEQARVIRESRELGEGSAQEPQEGHHHVPGRSGQPLQPDPDGRPAGRVPEGEGLGHRRPRVRAGRSRSGNGEPGCPFPVRHDRRRQNLMDAGEAFSQEPDRLVVFAGRAGIWRPFCTRRAPGSR